MKRLPVVISLQGRGAINRLEQHLKEAKATQQVIADIAAWEGWVIASARRKTAKDSSPPVHGRVVAWSLRRAGAKVFAFDDRTKQRAKEIFDRELSPVLKTAKTTGRADYQGTKKAFLAAASYLAESEVARMVKGEIGGNSPRLERGKLQMIAGRRISRRWGAPPPFGVRSGRYLEGLKGRAVRPRRRVG